MNLARALFNALQQAAQQRWSRSLRPTADRTCDLIRTFDFAYKARNVGGRYNAIRLAGGGSGCGGR